MIYVIIGCENLHQKSLPSLSYHFSKDVKAFKYPLDGDHAWLALKLEWCIEVDRKGAASVADVILPTNVRIWLFILVTLLTAACIVSEGLGNCQEA